MDLPKFNGNDKRWTVAPKSASKVTAIGLPLEICERSWMAFGSKGRVKLLSDTKFLKIIPFLRY